MKTIIDNVVHRGAFLKKGSLSPERNFFMERHRIFANYGDSSRVENSIPHHINCMVSLTEDARCAQCGKEFEP